MSERLRPDIHVPWPMEGDSDAFAMGIDPEMNKTPRPKIRGSKYKTNLPVPKPQPPPAPQGGK